MRNHLSTDSKWADMPMYTQDGYGCEDVDLRGFVSLMDLYENNFIRFKKLVPDFAQLANGVVSHVEGCLDIHIKVIERSRYTTTLSMTYHFTENDQMIAEPDLQLRIYHDASLVEVLSGHLKHGRERLDALPAHALRLKWKLNRFLYKWLGYCLYQGHSFGSGNEES